MFNPAQAAEEIKNEYVGYIETTYHFKDFELQQQLKSRLKETVSNGPFIEIKDSFVSGKSIRELINKNILSPLFFELEKNKSIEPKLPIDRPLYLHQEQAIEKIVTGKNVVISTGTGSGKTNCFLIPIINDLLKEKEQGILNDGVRAIFIYPMNALANDQIKGLREILMEYPDITFGVYNGGTEHCEREAIKLYEAMCSNEEYEKLRHRLQNERLSRDDIKKHPPHILFTNYAMLEHMLLRPGDDTIFENSNFKYVVLDEAHVYAGATGIETAFLMSRLKGRINGERPPQFILTSATLGDDSVESNKEVISFAQKLTGCQFDLSDIVSATREKIKVADKIIDYPNQLYLDLADEQNCVQDVLANFGINVDTDKNTDEILYDILSTSVLYYRMRQMGNIIVLDEFLKKMQINKDVAVAFIALCAKAKKEAKPLVDIRYHYFLRALDGCYLALDYKDSLSLTRKDFYSKDFGNITQKMFEIAVCDDCGEYILVGAIKNGKLIRESSLEKREYFQINADYDDEYENDVEDNDKTKFATNNYMLCKNCGAIVEEDSAHNTWCTCGNTNPIKVIKLQKDKCLNCNGNIRRFQLGYDSATSVIATALYEQIPVYSYVESNKKNEELESNMFLAATKQNTKEKVNTGKQFLVFSDSRQGAAKFACFLGDSYKEFLRRRSIWNVVKTKELDYPEGVQIDEFVKLLKTYFSSTKLFREDNSGNTEINQYDNNRNAWVAVLNEMYNSNRDTSLVSLGQLSFDYLGNTPKIVDVVVKNYNKTEENAKNFLNYLVFEIVKAGAILTNEPTDISDEDRKYLFYQSQQQFVTKNKTYKKNSKPFLPSKRNLKNGTESFFKSNKLILTKRFLNINDEEAYKFLEAYFKYLISKEGNEYCLLEKEEGYAMPAKNFKILLGENAILWKCNKCGKVTQFNIDGVCIHNNCNGKLEKVNNLELCKNNYYANLYNSEKLTPLFIKEHTAQLAKKEALEYQQQFVRKEINALSCSTTFEMGVNVGDLETVFLRNFPPLPSNYAQRVGRAGRSINAAAFAITYARLSSHDFTFFDNPKEMINGTIYPPQFRIENEKILKRHIYAIALSLYLKHNPEQYNRNNAFAFINEKGYVKFLNWLNSHPQELSALIKNSIPKLADNALSQKYIFSYEWLNDFIGESGTLTKIINEYEQNIEYLQKEKNKAIKAGDSELIYLFNKKLENYQRNNFIDFLVRGNILPKYGFPIDSVELSQNISSKSLKSLNLNRDLSVAIAEYAPSSEVIADGKLYTSRYIRKPMVNKNELNDFEHAYIAECPDCGNINYSNMPIGKDGRDCATCGYHLTNWDFYKSIEPRAGFIAETEVQNVPLSSQERKYKTEAIYIGDKTAYPIDKFNYTCGQVDIEIESTANDTLVVKSTDDFYVCPKCGYAIANDEKSKLQKYEDYGDNVSKIQKTTEHHHNPFGKGECNNVELKKYALHHEFKTDVAKISFKCDTSDKETMLSVMYALLNSFANTLNIEKRDIKACLDYKRVDGIMEHKIIIYDAVPGGAGHSRRLVTEDGNILKLVIKNAYNLLNSCTCDPSCYKCLRSYENQKIHEILNRKKALEFLKILCNVE